MQNCNAKWHTLQRQEKIKTIPNSFKGQMRIQVCSWKPAREDISMESGNFEFEIYILQQIPFSVKQIQENLDLNTKEMEKIQIQIHIWNFRSPPFWSSDMVTTLTTAVHQRIWSQCYAFFHFFPLPSYFLSTQDWLERDMMIAVKTVYPIRLFNKFSSMTCGHGREFENFGKDILLSAYFSPFLKACNGKTRTLRKQSKME